MHTLILVTLTAWLACAALAAGLLHHAPLRARAMALLGPLALLYLWGVILSPIDPAPGGET